MIQTKDATLTKNYINRKNFGKTPPIIEIPNLVALQKKSYEDFLQLDQHPLKRENKGLEEIFKSVFPISDLNKSCSLEYVAYEIGFWKCDCGEYKGLGGKGIICEKCRHPLIRKERYTIEECRQKGMTYAEAIKIMVRLVVWEKDENSGTSTVRDVKEQKIYLGDIPLMSDNGTFLINGIERVIVSQLHRSPGVFFVQEKAKGQSAGKIVYAARIIPYRGSWIDFEFDSKDILYVRIDRRRKLLATVILRALGFSSEDILKTFYPVEKIVYLPQEDNFKKEITRGKQKKRPGDRNKKTSPDFSLPDKKSGGKNIILEPEELIGKIIAQDVVNKENGEILLEINTEINPDSLKIIKENKITEFTILQSEEAHYNDSALRKTLSLDKLNNSEEALKEIYKRVRPADQPTGESAALLFKNIFFNPKRYDLSEVGRLKLNEKLGLDFPLSQRVLTKEDIVGTMKYLLNLHQGIGSGDDIDHLGNRRIRTVGESLGNHFRIGLVRMERAIAERMTIQDLEVAMPQNLINSKPITAAIKEFFCTNQLSQFMDQTNPLSEITHKRRLSAIGPGGLTRERAQFEVRDVHPTHYGRICPIETPEGPNIGLIASLSTYARINRFGFIETPFRKVVKGQATEQIEYLDATKENQYVIAQANALLDNKNFFKSELVSARHDGEFIMVPPEKVNYMDVSPKQLVSVAAALIPFLERDDANRALMGSNMQRQAVPLLISKAPLVGTGMERVVAKDSGAALVSKRKGEVVKADGNRIIVKAEVNEKETNSGVDIYTLIKYQRSNQNTCINYRPRVKAGDKLEKGELLADGQATDHGELALGKNILVAFMPWHGYNFEDAIIISEKIVKEDVFTSIHIEEFELEARETKQGKEEITRDIPNVNEEALRNLDENGITRIGAWVKTGDILVGKITPKEETQLSPEEKLLKAIFGEKAGDVKDTSLRVPTGIEGVVIDVKVFWRKGAEKDQRAIAIEKEEISQVEKNFSDELNIIKAEKNRKIRDLLSDKTVAKKFSHPKTKKLIINKGKKITPDILNLIDPKYFLNISLRNKEIQEKITQIEELTARQIRNLKDRKEESIAKIKKNDELPPGVIKKVKVFVAMKRKLQIGDKMAGRHGNKGVVSIIVPEEDMPCLPDGTPIEIILNPLGVPSRMNVGQIFETYLGLAAKALNLSVATPVFEGIGEKEIKKLLKEAGFTGLGETRLYDGMTGLPYDQKVVVGYIYILKLHHIVADKIHARSTGPYSLVTQQPLGGKAQFGGQRLGEMEVWALEAYGAAHTLQEMLTVKADDVEGRRRMYEAIVKGDNSLQPSIPESFNVLVKELQSLVLDVELLED